MIDLDDTLLDRSPEETCRRLCLGLLDEARQALDRIEKGEDDEALHDFRVALRRLRSSIRAYRPYLKGSAGKKVRRGLKALASSTNAARDTEVQLEWLQTKAEELDADERAGAAHVAAELQKQAAAAPRAELLREEFDAIHADLRKSLRRLRLRLDEGGESFLAAAGKLVDEKGRVLQESLQAAAVETEGKLEELHRARIEAKRLRYLLEPVEKSVAGVKSLVKELKSLQDVLGDLQDTRVLSETVARELESAAAEEARRLGALAFHEGRLPDDGAGTPAHPGLLALLRVQRERRERCLDELSRKWLGSASEGFFRDVQELSERLSSTAAEERPPPRRFLLSGVPEEVRRKTPRLLRQAFFPGRRIREELVSTTSGARTRHLRIAAFEDGSREEENLSKDAFAKFWELCDGRRLERRRYEIREDGRTWRVDEVLDRNLVLAETEGNSEITIPSWLEGHVVREVTGSKRYDWESIAKTKPSAP